MNINAGPTEQNPEIWGPYVWASIHSLANRADETNEDFGPFLESIKRLLPCTKCKIDFMAYIETQGLPLKNKAFEWTVTFHNAVNKKLNKKIFSYEAAVSQWSNAPSQCSYTCTTAANKKTTINFTQKLSFAIIVTIIIVLLAVKTWMTS